MATTITSPNTNDVVNWAYQYSLACAKLSAAESAATSSATRKVDTAAAKASFNATMKSLVPTDVQSSVQFQYMDALTAYNTDMAAATNEAGRQAAMTNLYTALGNITMPSATSTTLDSLVSDTLSAQKTNLSNAAADLAAMLSDASSMASNAGTAWLSAVASGANTLNSKASSLTESTIALLSQLGLDTSGVSTPTISTEAASTFAAASAAAATGGSSGAILNAALAGYLVANQATGTDTG
jgi:hypothetical protein